MSSTVRLGLLVACAAFVVLASSATSVAKPRHDDNDSSKNSDDNQRHNDRDRDKDQKNFKGNNNQQVQPFVQGQNDRDSRRSDSDKPKTWQTFKKESDRNDFPRHTENERRDWQKWFKDYDGGPRPFSNEWYEAHPQAWQHHQDHDDAWKYATGVGVLSWLGWEAVHPHHNNTVIYEPMPLEPIYFEGQGGAPIDGANGEWMPLGVYSLTTGPGANGNRLVQLSVNRQGRVRGNYHDMITNASFPVIGVIDQQSQMVRWTLDNNRQLTFAAPLEQLTQSQGVVNVRLPGGQTQQWQFARLENAAQTR